jgi:hypothetical protein
VHRKHAEPTQSVRQWPTVGLVIVYAPNPGSA